MTKKSLFWHQIQVFAVYNVFVTVSLFFAIFNFWTRDVSCCATLSYTNINTFLKKKIQFVIPPPKLNKLNVIEFLREELFAQFYMFFLIKWSARCSTGKYWICSSTAECERPQQATTNLRSWSQDNNIRFNASKCKVLSITSKKKPLLQNYFLGPEKLLRVLEEKDLGVVISDKLTCDSHLHLITAKVIKLLGLLRRSFYLAIVKPHLCYTSEAWPPAQKSLKVKVEQVQRRTSARCHMGRDCSPWYMLTIEKSRFSFSFSKLFTATLI